MNGTPQVSDPGQYTTVAGAGQGPHSSNIKQVNGDGTVDVWVPASTGNNVHTSLPYVTVGGTPPTGVDYFQATA